MMGFQFRYEPYTKYNNKESNDLEIKSSHTNTYINPQDTAMRKDDCNTDDYCQSFITIVVVMLL